VLVSWLPWNHTYGGNAVLNNVLTNGGTLYIDNGRPMPGEFEKTLSILREVSPTAYQNVPAAYSLLVPELERDAALAETFFKRLKTLAYGGAALSQDLCDRTQAVAIRTIGHRIPFLAGYGATETAPTVMSVHWPTERTGFLGLPLPGVTLKLVPNGGKLEVRVKGDCITPGYHKSPDLTAAAFDQEGYYRLGDAAKFVDPDDPAQGLMFDGRVAEDFKLDTGTWVNAGRVRIAALEAADGLLNDALIAGLDWPFIALLGFPNLAACQAIAGDATLPLEQAATHPKVLRALAERLARHNASHPGSSTRIARALLLAEPPSFDAGEITDKGYINQSRALERRAGEVVRAYASAPDEGVVAL
jgi:feruloyl-CoA synthase